MTKENMKVKTIAVEWRQK